MPVARIGDVRRRAAVVAARSRAVLGRYQGAGAASFPARGRRQDFLGHAGADRLGDRARQRERTGRRLQGARFRLPDPGHHGDGSDRSAGAGLSRQSLQRRQGRRRRAHLGRHHGRQRARGQRLSLPARSQSRLAPRGQGLLRDQRPGASAPTAPRSITRIPSRARSTPSICRQTASCRTSASS